MGIPKDETLIGEYVLSNLAYLNCSTPLSDEFATE